ncbi:hypothetical protein PL81_33420 [Streptomyces sp. RSD-27]|nr:hypothetical protein PL81_33420 [Streptomyces sp. RSD-27]
MRLLDDTVTALSPLFEADVPLHLWPQKDRSLRITAFWEDEDEMTRRRQLRDADKALKQAGLSLEDPRTHVACTAEALATPGHSGLEVVRSA